MQEGSDQIKATEIDGVPVFWAESPGPFTGALLFRVGKADETLPRAGISHMVEHLAIFPFGRLDHPVNGLVDDTRTIFYASGEPHEVASFISGVCRNLGSLPIERLEQERRVLRAEIANTPTAHPFWSLRFGARSYGLTSYAELGMHWLGEDMIQAWSDERFNRSNCVAWFSGSPPDALRFELPAGTRFAPPVPEQLAGVETPAYVVLDDATVGLSFLAERGTAINAGHGMLVEQAQDHLRRDLGLTYGVGSTYWRLTGDLAHLVVLADCTPGHAGAVRDGLLRVQNELTTAGPSVAALDRHKELAQRYWNDPHGLPSMLDSYASDALFGKEPTSVSELLEELAALTPEDIAGALSEAAETMLISLPLGVTVSKDIAKLYDAAWVKDPVPGQEFEMKVIGEPGRVAKVVIGDAGVSYVDPDGVATTVLFEDCVLVALEGDYAITVIDYRGERVSVDFGSDEKRETISNAILSCVDGSLVARINQDVTERAQAVRDLAETRMAGNERLRELNLLARFMFEAEKILDLANAAWRGDRGLLGLTDVRLLLVSADTGTMLAEVLREQVTAAEGSRGLRSGALKVATERGDITFESVKPAARAKEIAAALDGSQASK